MPESLTHTVIRLAVTGFRDRIDFCASKLDVITVVCDMFCSFLVKIRTHPLALLEKQKDCQMKV